MERMLVSGVAADKHVARISVIGVQNEPGIAFKIFNLLARHHINVDIIIPVSYKHLVNDYLAKRDAEWMGRVHEFLGRKVGVVLNSMTSDERREAYNCDITYVTNNELGFDYLRDNMAIYKEPVSYTHLMSVRTLQPMMVISAAEFQRILF